MSGAGAWLVFVVAASVAYRRSRGKDIFPGRPEGAVYYDGMGSGCSRKNWLTWIGGARNCLRVAVTKERLTVTPFFPFNMMFLPEIYDLDHDIPLGSIRGVKERRVLFWTTIRIDYDDPAAGIRSIELLVKKRDDLIKAIGGIKP